jgi:hypothetical protein
MIILTQTTDKIQVKLSSSVGSSQLHCYSSYRDTTTTSITPGRNVVLTNNTTSVDLVGSPSASTQRCVEYMSVYNADTASATVSFYFNDNGTLYEIGASTILPGQKTEYQSGLGFKVLDQFGSEETSIVYPDTTIVSGWDSVILGTDVTNNNAVANTMQDVTGLGFSVVSGGTYWFKFNFIFTSPAGIANGNRFSINGPTTSLLAYQVLLIASTTSAGLNINGMNSYDLPATPVGTSPLSGGTAWVEGIATFSANGTLIGRFAAELANTAIVAKAGSVVYYKKLN